MFELIFSLQRHLLYIEWYKEKKLVQPRNGTILGKPFRRKTKIRYSTVTKDTTIEEVGREHEATSKEGGLLWSRAKRKREAARRRSFP